MTPDIAYPFVMDRMKAPNRAIAESTFGYLDSTREDARKERRAVAAACKVCIEIKGNTQPDVLQADLYNGSVTFMNVSGGETGPLYLFQSNV